MAAERKIFKPVGRTLLRLSLEAAAVIIILWLAFRYTGQILCRAAITQIGQLTNTKITSEIVEFNLDGSVNIGNLAISTNEEDPNSSELLRAEAIHAHFSIGSLFRLRPTLSTININNFTFTADYNEDNNRWNFSNFQFTDPGEPGKIPVIRLSQGKLLYRKVSCQGAETIFQAAMDAKLEPLTGKEAEKKYLPLPEDELEKSREIYFFEAATTETDGRKGQWQGKWRPGKFELSGGFETKDADIKGWDLSGVRIALDYLPTKDYSLKLHVEDLFARQDLVEQTFSNFEPLLPAASSVAGAVRQFFHYYQPSGKIGVDIDASGNLSSLQTGTFKGKIWCKDVRFCDIKLPYYIEHSSGAVDVTEKSAVINQLKGRHGDVDLTVDGWVELVEKKLRYDILISSKNMLLEKELYTSLGEKQRKMWNDFSPIGRIAVEYRQSRLSDIGRTSTMEIGLLGNQAQWKKLGLPLYNLSGSLIFKENQVEIKDIISQKDGEKIIINGRATGASEKDEKYDLEIRGETIAGKPSEKQGLIEILSSMLNNPLAELSKKVQVTGNLNFFLKLNNYDTNDFPQYSMDIECTGNKVVFEDIPYPLNDVRGKIKINKGEVTLENITAAASADNIIIEGQGGTIKIDGLINLPENKFKSADFNIEANDIYLDKQLGSILPKGLRDFYFDIAPSGRLDLDYRNTNIAAGEDGRLSVDFDGQVRFKSCSFGSAGAVSSLEGILKTKGIYKSQAGFDNCQIEFDNAALRVFDKLITNLKTRMHYDGSLRTWTGDSLTFSSYNGIMTGKYSIQQTDSGWGYLLDIGMQNVDMQKLLSDPYRFQGRPQDANETGQRGKAVGYTKGDISGSLSIAGLFADKQSLIGRLRLKVTNMEAGKLSLLGKLLALLNLTEPKDFAFDQMIIDSFARGRELIINEVDISGSAAAFRGSGRMNLIDKELELSLTARGQRLASEEPGMLQALTEGFGQGIVQMEVRGPIDEPKITVTTLPVLQETLGLFGTKENKPKK